MDLRLLGPLQAFENGRAVNVGRGRESALLALLAIHANEALATDRIVDELWGESAPENATKSVQIYVSRLRKSLGNERIETTAGGYLLRLGADELDSARFEHLATTGRRQVEGGDVAVGERTLSEALGLWSQHSSSFERHVRYRQGRPLSLEVMLQSLRTGPAARHDRQHTYLEMQAATESRVPRFSARCPIAIGRKDE